MYLDSKGYVIVRAPEHPLAKSGGRVLEHRKVWYDAYGSLLAGTIVHHKNGNRTDNRLENLELHTRRTHARHHFPNGFITVPWNKGRRDDWAELACIICKKKFRRRFSQIRRGKNLGYYGPCCSRRCANFVRHRALREES